MGTIALLTDFGEADGFVGMMKGAILNVAPGTQIVDINHQVAAYDVRAAAFLLQRSYRHFPKGTVFVAVVDPGVGSARRIVAAQGGDYFFVAPDNGLLSYVLSEFDTRRVVSVENEEYFVKRPARTFHGRDIMAPVAAHLVSGVSLTDLGPEVESYVRLPLPSLLKRDNCVIGEIVYVDKFGNMISNVAESDLPPHESTSDLVCKIGDRDNIGFADSYAESQGLSAIISGLGTVEVFLNRARAADQFTDPIGSTIAIIARVASES